MAETSWPASTNENSSGMISVVTVVDPPWRGSVPTIVAVYDCPFVGSVYVNDQCGMVRAPYVGVSEPAVANRASLTGPFGPLLAAAFEVESGAAADADP